MDAIQSAQLTQFIQAEAKGHGFFLCGVAPAITPPHYGFFCDWLDKGWAGTMDYLPARREAYAHPRSVLDGAQSVVMLGASYFVGDPLETTTGSGRVARYAWSRTDYHDWIHARLKAMIARLTQDCAKVGFRGVVDTAPLLERDFARLAGLGWVGKNTMLIHKRAGSYFFLAALLVDVPLEYDSPHVQDHCGTCTRCLDACPTSAFPAPGVMDARRCISYLTIEHRGSVDPELRPLLGDWWFGCDICQEVCPWNRHADSANASSPDPPEAQWWQQQDLHQLLSMSSDQFRREFRKTPLWRTRWSGALRNAAYVLGNQRDVTALALLGRILCEHSEPDVRGAAAWALGQIGGSAAREWLNRARQLTQVPDTIEEIDRALQAQPLYSAPSSEPDPDGNGSEAQVSGDS
jgi:epoxyqueuosine reductase